MEESKLIRIKVSCVVSDASLAEPESVVAKHWEETTPAGSSLYWEFDATEKTTMFLSDLFHKFVEGTNSLKMGDS